MLKKLNIRAKLMLDLVPLAVIIVALLAMLWAGEISVMNMSRQVYYEQLKTLSDKLITCDRDFYQAMMAMEEMNMASKRGDASTADEKKADYEENATQVSDGLGEIRAIMETDAFLFREYRIDGVEASCEELLAAALDGFSKWKDTCDMNNTDMMETYFYEARDQINSLEDVLVEYTGYQDKKLETKIHMMVLITVGVVAVILVFMTILTVKIIRYIRINMVKVADSVVELADGRFVPIQTDELHDDELGHTIGSTNALIDKLGEIITNIKSAAGTVHESSRYLAGTADQIAATTDGITVAVNGIAEGATQQADEIQNANVNVERIADAVASVMNNSIALEQTADKMNNESKQASEELEKLRASSEDMSGSIEEITQRINETSAAVESINDKVAAITSIASQTNLLALNASIEAARAGDAGRGFAVVAEEIGKLADDSAKSADDIRKQMEVLLSQSQSAVKTANEVQRTNAVQQDVISNTVSSISVLIDAIATTVEGVRSIHRSAAESEAAKGVVVDVMNSLSAISEENAASTEETSASMQELSATFTVLAQSAEDLQRLSDALAEDVSFFK